MNIDTQESSDDIEDDYYTTCRKVCRTTNRNKFN